MPSVRTAHRRAARRVDRRARRLPAASGLLRRPAALAGLLVAIAASGATQSPAHGMGLPKPLPWATSRLTVAYDDGEGRTSTYRLTCGKNWGSEGCRQLEEIGGPAAPVDPGQMCSMIYGGPQTAEVTGTWGGRPVQETYRRTNGCEVARWSQMVPALPDPAGGAPRSDLEG